MGLTWTWPGGSGCAGRGPSAPPAPPDSAAPQSRTRRSALGWEPSAAWRAAGGEHVSGSVTQQRLLAAARFYLSADVQVVLHGLQVHLSWTGGRAVWLTPPLRFSPGFFAPSLRPLERLRPIKHLQTGGDAVNL